MRNLKRALSLALASVMLLGMMVVGTSAASYPDVDENDNVEAIEVLNAVNVMIGDRGNFRPDAKVNRHEMAVIMAKLVLGNDVADNYVGTHPFTDTFPWADKYVAACYENDLISGRGGNLFAGNQPLKAVEAASMMLRALGYKDLNKGADDWRAPLVAMANQLRLFNGVTSNPNQELDRNQVAQLVLNTLKSSVVDLKDGTFNISDGSGTVIVTGGNREYIVRSSHEAYARAINDTERAGNSASGVEGYTVELGEHLYDGDLKLSNHTIDAFGRPSRYWEYKGNAIGTYAKKELLVKSFDTAVKGRDAYNLLGQTAVDAKDLLVFVDGAEDTTSITKAHIARSNTSDLALTGRGVTTEFYLDNTYNEITIVVVNTYLAKAQNDYNTTTEDIRLNVYYGVNNTNPPVALAYPVTVEVEDYDIIKGLEADDLVRVTMAAPDHVGNAAYTGYTIESIDMPKVVADTALSDYSIGTDTYNGNIKRLSNVTTEDNTRYNTAAKAFYDEELFFQYSGDVEVQLRDAAYDLYLDQFGNILGIEQVSKEDRYIFVVGYDVGSAVLAQAIDKALIIHTDGSMETVNIDDSKLKVWDSTTRAWQDAVNNEVVSGDDASVNAWFTYSVKADGTYVLDKMVDKQGFQTRGAGEANYIDAQHGSLTTVAATNVLGTGHDIAAANAYGNDNSVYIAVEADGSVVRNGSIVKVRGTTTGLRNASIRPDDVSGLADITNNVYFMYNSRGFVTYAVVIGTDGSAGYEYIYLNSAIKRTIDDKANDRFLYEYEGIIDGELKTFRSTVNSAYVATAAAGVITETAATAAPAKYNMIRAEVDADGLVTKMVKLPVTAAGEMNPTLNDDYGYTFKLDANTAVAGTDDISGLQLRANTLWVLSPANEDNYTLLEIPSTIFVRNPSSASSDFTVYSNAEAAVNAVNNIVSTNQGMIKAVASANTAVTGYANTVVVDIDYVNNPSVPPVSPMGMGEGAYWNNSNREVDLRYYGDLLTDNEIKDHIGRVFGSPVVNLNKFLGQATLADGTVVPVNFTQIEVIKINLDGALAKYVDVGTSNPTVNVPTAAGKYLKDVKYLASSGSELTAVSGVVTMTGVTAATGTDINLWTAYSVTGLTKTVDNNGTAVTINDGGYVAPNTVVTVTGADTTANYRQFTVNGTKIGSPVKGTAGTASTMTWPVTAATTFAETTGVMVKVDGRELGVVATAAPGNTVTFTGYASGSKFAKMGAAVANTDNKLFNAVVTTTESVNGFTYTAVAGDAVAGVIELVQVVEVTFTTPVTAPTFALAAGGNATLTTTDKYVKVGTALTITGTNVNTQVIKAAVNSGTPAAVEGGTAGDGGTTLASATWTTKNTESTVAFTQAAP